MPPTNTEENSVGVLSAASSVLHGYIYLTICLLDTDVKWYIGKHRTNKFDPRYKGSGKDLEKAFQKLGKHNFSVELICWASSAEELDGLEKYHIAFYRSLYGRRRMYNIAKGGSGGGCFAEETKRKISKTLKGRKCPPRTAAHRLALSLAQTGKKLSKVGREKIARALTGNKNHFGKKHSNEAKEKIALSKLAAEIRERQLL